MTNKLSISECTSTSITHGTLKYIFPTHLLGDNSAATGTFKVQEHTDAVLIQKTNTVMAVTAPV